MKLLKTLAIIFFGLILFAGVASYSGASEKSSTNIGEQIDQLERLPLITAKLLPTE